MNWSVQGQFTRNTKTQNMRSVCVCLALHIKYIVKYKVEVWEESTFLLEKQISVLDKYKVGFNSLSNRFLKMKANKAKQDSSWLLGIK